MAYNPSGGGYPPNYPPYEERQPRQEPLPFFISGEGIIRQVIQTDLPRYLGNNAYSRPGHNQGVEGFWYSAYRPLTDAQIQSLKTDSQKWATERDLMSRYYPGREPPGYERSTTFKDSLRTNSDGNNPNHQYTPQNPMQAPTSFSPYGTAPGYSHSTTYGSSSSTLPTPGGPVPANNRRFELVTLPDGQQKWYDYELKQYVPPHNPPESASTVVPRPREDPPTSVPDDTENPYRRMDPGGGPDAPTPGYYQPPGGPYFPRN